MSAAAIRLAFATKKPITWRACTGAQLAELLAQLKERRP